MPRSRLDRSAALVVVLALTGLLQTATGTDAAFVVSTSNAANGYSSNPDWKPPLIAGAAVVKAEGGIPGFVRAGGSYTVVAAVSDDPSSNPPSGIASVSGDVSALTSGATAEPLGAGAATVGGATWSHRSATLPVPAGRVAGDATGSVTARDAASPVNTSVFSFSAVVDNTAPTRTSAVTANGGAAGRIDAGDSVTYLWSDIVDPESVLAGWSGASTPVTVHVTNSGSLLQPGDLLTVRDAAGTTQLRLGTLRTNLRDYVSATTTFGGPGNAIRSTMTWNATTGAITVLFGPPDSAGTVNTTTEGSMNDYDWLPEIVFDRAGNRSDTATYTDPGGAQRGF